MDIVCTEMAGLEQQRKGFDTFVMTGDAIIRTNFNPFKPTRQLSHDPPVVEFRDQPKAEFGVSNDQRNNNRDNNEPEEKFGAVVSPYTCSQNKEFIPGFMRVSETSDAKPHVLDETTFSAEDSGIDVRLSLELDETMPATRHAAAEYQTYQSQVTEPSCDLTTVDEPSAKRFATRLYQLDGFKLTDVSHYLSKSDEFTKKVVEEFMSFFDFTGYSLTESLRTFLKQISLAGEVMKEQETVLLHFARRYLECNKLTEFSQTFHSEDSCHTLVCALVLLNTDLHGSTETDNRQVTQRLFTESLSKLNNGVDFPKQYLTVLYRDISGQPLFSTMGDEDIQKRLSDAINYGVEPIDTKLPQRDTSATQRCYSNSELSAPSGKSFLNQFSPGCQMDDEMMTGYLLKKHCKGSNGIKTASGKRGWKRHFVILQGLKLKLLKSDKRSHSHKACKSIDLNNAYATVASYYTKRKYGFSLITSDGSEFLFIAGNCEIRQEWIDSINLTSASYSSEDVLDNSIAVQEESSLQTSATGTPSHMREKLRRYKLYVKDIGDQLITDQDHFLKDDESKKHMKEVSKQRLLQEHLMQKYTTYVNVLTKRLNLTRGSNSSKQHLAIKPTDITKSEQLYLAGSRLSYRLAVYDERL